ncbi:MAG: GlsB/YeaQ/YmgE family stress response membrane protein [Bryobacteraceae bacterium]|nr:GlsB/YeaQ/YmgE family stress response membrane protein [Bryobacteraceae bacterium]
MQIKDRSHLSSIQERGGRSFQPALHWEVGNGAPGTTRTCDLPGKDPGGWIITILLGIAGAWVGGWLGSMLGFYQDGDSAGFIMSVIGSLVLLGGYRMITKRKAA